jgi:hypothetical protein
MASNMAERIICALVDEQELIGDEMINEHSRLRIQKSRDKDKNKAENIHVDNSIKIIHVTVQPSAEVNELQTLLQTKQLKGIRNVNCVFYLSVGQIKHFVIDMKSQVQGLVAVSLLLVNVYCSLLTWVLCRIGTKLKKLNHE